jgi:hypothetical protein
MDDGRGVDEVEGMAKCALFGSSITELEAVRLRFRFDVIIVFIPKDNESLGRWHISEAAPGQQTRLPSHCCG